MAARGERSVPPWLKKARVLHGPPPTVRPDFRREFLDFKRGIRMGNLEPNQRITQILRHALETRHGTRFITDRWGRGVYWQWICWLPVENRAAKPLSSGYNFGCAKFYITIDEDSFEAGMQIERAPLRSGRAFVRARQDWDFYALVRGLRRGTKLAREIARLVRDEGFTVRAGLFGGRREYTSSGYRGPAPLRQACEAMPPDDWGGFQLCYVFSRDEVQTMSGAEIVEAVTDIFNELCAAMNAVMTVPCLRTAGEEGKG